MDPLAHEFEAYFAGTVTDEQFRAIEAWINADPANARSFMQQLHFRGLVAEHLREQRSDNGVVLAELARFEAAQHADMVTILDLDEQIRQQNKGPISAGDLKIAGGYVLRHALTPKRLAYAGLAAAVLLGLTIVIALQGNTPSPNTPTGITQTPDVMQDTKQTVATLGVQHEAQWAEGGMASGSPLLAGQRLTLTAGFAEVVTGRGAIAILEAPCTVELIDDNTRRLTQGKLVGNVPPQAIGFTVNTPTAKIIDYGTTFGVEITSDGNTHTAVFEGEVDLREASPASDRPKRSVRLTAGWASQVSDQGLLQDEPMAVTKADQVRYARSIDEAASPVFAYRRAVLASRPMVYWGFDEDPSATKNLANEAKWSGKAMGNTARGEGVIGSALKLAGDIDIISGVVIDTPLKLTTTAAYTIEAWYHTDQPHWGRILSLSLQDSPEGKSWAHLTALEVLGGESLSQLFENQSGQARFYHRGELNQDSLDLFSNTPAPLGQWAHVVAVRDGQSSRLYINGQLVSEQQDNQAAVQDALIQLHVGVLHRTPGQEPVTNPVVYRVFNGLIDEVAVYDHALAAEQIASHYQLGLMQSPLGDE